MSKQEDYDAYVVCCKIVEGIERQYAFVPLGTVIPEEEKQEYQQALENRNRAYRKLKESKNND